MARETRWPFLRLSLAATIIAGALVGIDNTVRGQDQERITVLEENDSLFFNSDKHYTQGFRISDLHPVRAPGFWDGAFDLLGGFAPIFAPGGNRQESLFLGQSIFTPKNTHNSVHPILATDLTPVGSISARVCCKRQTNECSKTSSLDSASSVQARLESKCRTRFTSS